MKRDNDQPATLIHETWRGVALEIGTAWFVIPRLHGLRHTCEG